MTFNLNILEADVLSNVTSGFKEGFVMKDDLHEDFWEDEKLDNNIRQRLMKIAVDFFEKTGIGTEKIKDITFTGSLANFNYSGFSDIDLHIIVDFSEVDDNAELVKEMFDAKRFQWNKAHNILINNHEVEIYVQGESEPHESTGVYSLVNDEWLATPQREDPDIDWENVEKKANWLMGQIDRTQALFDEEEYGDAHAHAIRIGDKIKRFRQSGLEREGAFSPENVAFKVLRRNDYLGILSGLKVNSYDKKMSIPSGESLTIKVGNLVEKWKRHLNEEDAPEKKTTSHEISIRVAINKKTGLTKADTFANIRAIRGVTTVNVVPGTVADGLTSYYETLAIRFCCEPPADSNPGLYLKHSLMKGMKSVAGLTVVRTIGMPQEL